MFPFLRGRRQCATPRSRTLVPVVALVLAHFAISLSPARGNTVESLQAVFADAYVKGRFFEAVRLAREKLQLVENETARKPGDLWQAHYDLGASLVGQKDFDDAVSSLQRAEGNLAPDVADAPLKLAQTKNMLGVAQLGRGDREGAERTLSAILDGLTGTSEAELILRAKAYYALSNLNREAGDLDRALDLGERSHEIRSKLLGPGHIDVAASLTALGSAFWARGQYVNAAEFYGRALAVADVPSNSDQPDLATILNNLATAKVELGEFEAAIPLHKRALSIRERSFGPDHYDVSVSLNNIGNALRELGHLEDAETQLKAALEIREHDVTPSGPALAPVLNNLALVYAAMNRGAEVEGMYRRAISILDPAPDAGRRGLGQLLTNLGRLYLDLGRNGEAEEALRRAVDVSRKWRPPKHHEIATALSFLGLAEIRVGRAKDALSHLTEALDIRKEMLGPNHGHTGIAHSRLGEAYLLAGDDRSAEAHTREGLAIQEMAFGPDHINLMTAHHQLGLVLVAQEKIDVAFVEFERAIEIFQANEALVGGPLGTTDRSRIQELFLDHLAVAWRLSQTSGKKKSDLEEAAFNSAQLGLRTAAARALKQMSMRTDVKRPELADHLRKLQDAGHARNAIDQRLLSALGTSNPMRDESKIETLRGQLKRADKEVATLTEDLIAQFPEYVELIKDSPISIAALQKLLEPDEAAILISSNGMADRHRKNAFIWALTNEEVRWLRSDLGAEDLSEKVQSLRCGLDEEEWAGLSQAAQCSRLLGIGRPADSAPLPFHLGKAHELYQGLFGEVEDLIRDKRLIVVPSGALTGIPFHVLVTKAPETALPESFGDYRGVSWLGRAHAINTLPSGSSLRVLREHARTSSAAKAYIGYGNPLLDGDGSCGEIDVPDTCPKVIVSPAVPVSPGTGRAVMGGSSGRRSPYSAAMFDQGAATDVVMASVRALCPLPDTAYEIRCVAERLGSGSEIRLQEQATEADINDLSARGELAGYRVVHFATHGLLAGDIEIMARRQGEPALVMTPPGEAANADDDGLLTASEIAGLKLDADWVVLSACNTASSDKPGAEALSGLAKAFFYAGARALLVSHWPVYSDAAVRLTTHAFNSLQASAATGRAQALRQAMIALMDDPNPSDNVHPAVWAPFVLVGEGASHSAGN